MEPSKQSEIILRSPGITQGVSNLTRINVSQGDLVLFYPKYSNTVYGENAQPLLGVFDRLEEEEIMHLRERAFLLQLPLIMGKSKIAYPGMAGTTPRYNTHKIAELYVEPTRIANNLIRKTNGLDMYADWIRNMQKPYEIQTGLAEKSS